jgi:hypothetical protein
MRELLELPLSVLPNDRDALAFHVAVLAQASQESFLQWLVCPSVPGSRGYDADPRIETYEAVRWPLGRTQDGKG